MSGRQGLDALSWSAIASLLAGLGALGFLTVGRFAVGLTEFAPMAHVWIVWSVSAATVGFGAQIETVEGLAKGGNSVSRRHLTMTALGAAVTGVTAFVWRNSLFATDSLFWPAICGIIPIGSLITGISRGALAVADDRRRLAVMIAGENTVRFAGALLLWGLGATPRLLAVVLLAGFGVAVLALPDLGLPRAGTVEPRASSGGAGAFAGLVAHLCLVLPPSILALQGSEPEVVAAVFLVLTYVRAPYQFLLGMGPVLTAQSFSGLWERQRGRFSDSRKTTWVALASLLAAAVIGLLVGDVVSSLILGRTDIVTSVDYAIMAALVMSAAIAILRTLHVLAQGRRALVLRSWGTAALVGVIGAVTTMSPTALFAILLGGVLACLLQLIVPAPSTQSSLRFGGDDQL